METNALAGADAITLPAGIYRLAIAGAGENTARTGDLDITDHLTIRGAGADNTIIDAGGLDRVFHVQPTRAIIIAWNQWRRSGRSGPEPKMMRLGLDLIGVTVRNGNANREGAAAAESRGGGIRMLGGVLTLTDSVVSESSARDGGGISSAEIMETTAQVALYNSTVRDNSATEDGGGISSVGSLTLANSSVTGNSALDGGGIALPSSQSSAFLTDSVVEGNSASGKAGGIYTRRQNLTLIDSPVKGNSATLVSTNDLMVMLTDTTFSDNPVVAESLKQAAKAYNRGDYREALQIRLTLAQEGVKEAQQLVGEMLREGDVVEQSYEGAAYWHRLAAEQGLADAQNDLGVLYHQGLGVPKDFKNAAVWYHEAARQSHQRAQLNIGGLWFNGDGVPQDYGAAALWFVSAQEGDNSALRAAAIGWVSEIKQIEAAYQRADGTRLTGGQLIAVFLGISLAVALHNDLERARTGEEWRGYYQIDDGKKHARLMQQTNVNLFYLFPP